MRSGPVEKNECHQIKISDYAIWVCLSVTALMVAVILLVDRVFPYEIAPQPTVARSILHLPARPLPPVSPVPEAESPSPTPTAPPAPVSAGASADTAPAASVAPMETPPEEVAPAPPPVKAATEAPAPTAAPEPLPPPGNLLYTIRGGRHPRFASIVFEFRRPVDFIKPTIDAATLSLTLRNTQTDMRPYRAYRTFDAWVRLTSRQRDVDVRIGLPPAYSRHEAFTLTAPHRLVVNLFHADQKRPPATEKKPAAVPATLVKIRSGRHAQYFTIVFDLDRAVDFGPPQVTADDIRLRLAGTTTRLGEYRRYQSFDTWVRLTPLPPDMAVRIGKPGNFKRLSAFSMKDPHRVVVNLYYLK